MAEDIGLMEWAFKGSVGAIIVAGGYLWRNLVTDVKTIRDDLIAHKLFTAGQIYTKGEVNDMVRETKDSVKRIHEILDKLDQKLDNRGRT